MIISGQIIDLHNKRIFPGEIEVTGEQITAIRETAEAPQHYILPGFVDAHIHIESSMLTPAAFARLAVVHGTVATVSDPHEIANVCGIAGIDYMLHNAAQSPFCFFFGAPACVPATGFETAGARLDAPEVTALLQRSDIGYLSEMMNYPGVLHADPDIMAKIAAAHHAGKPVDGHAPGLRGQEAARYAAAGISTDHECVSLDEALDKIAAGMHILIREGSAARNFDALIPLMGTHPQRIMFCCDDKHPDELLLHHINNHVKRAIAAGYDLFDVLRAACINPVLHYNLPIGMLRTGDPADFITLNNLHDITVTQTWIKGKLVADKGTSLLPRLRPSLINNFHALPRQASDFRIPVSVSQCNIRVIEAIEGQLVTRPLILPGKVVDGALVSDTQNDILKMVVINRYTPSAPPAFAFIRNFGLTQGAIASTVAHDCHNIIAIGADDESICSAVNAIIGAQGGIAVANAGQVQIVPLPVAGLMSDEDGETIAAGYTGLNTVVRSMGCTMHAPFMTLSFMALLVIPALKLSDKGLFDGSTFSFTPLVVE